MRKHFLLFLSTIVSICLFIGNCLSVVAAPIADRPPEPVGSRISGDMQNLVCKSVEIDTKSNTGSITCINGFSSYQKVNMELPNLIVTGPYPNYGLVGVPVAYGYRWQNVDSLHMYKDNNTIIVKDGIKERYNGLVTYVQIRANAENEGLENYYGNLGVVNVAGGGVFGVLQSGNVPDGSKWDSALGFGVEGWRNTSGSMGAFSMIDGELRTTTSIESALGVQKGYGRSSTHRWPDGVRYYEMSYAPDYFFAVTSVASSYTGGGSRNGEPAFQVSFEQNWEVWAKQKWDSIDRYMYWTEEECHMEPGLYPWSPEVDVCEDVAKEGWLIADTSSYDGRWERVGGDLVITRNLFVDNTSGGSGLQTYVNIDYYQSQPLLSRD